MIMKLISMTDFVLEQNKIGMEIQSLTHQQSDRARRFYLVSKYAKFLKQPLTLGMFIPCDDKRNILEEPKEYDYNLGDIHAGYYREDLIKYQQAKERVLFEGWKIIHQDKVRITIECDCFQLDWAIAFNSFDHYAKIENLSHLNFEITQSALKQIGL